MHSTSLISFAEKDQRNIFIAIIHMMITIWNNHQNSWQNSVNCYYLVLIEDKNKVLKMDKTTCFGSRSYLRWLNTVLIPVFHSPFSPNPLIPRSPKLAASKLTTQTLAFWWLRWRMCRCHGNMSKYKQAFKIGFVYL